MFDVSYAVEVLVFMFAGGVRFHTSVVFLAFGGQQVIGRGEFVQTHRLKGFRILNQWIVYVRIT